MDTDELWSPVKTERVIPLESWIRHTFSLISGYILQNILTEQLDFPITDWRVIESLWIYNIDEVSAAKKSLNWRFSYESMDHGIRNERCKFRRDRWNLRWVNVLWWKMQKKNWTRNDNSSSKSMWNPRKPSTKRYKTKLVEQIEEIEHSMSHVVWSRGSIAVKMYFYLNGIVPVHYDKNET